MENQHVNSWEFWKERKDQMEELEQINNRNISLSYRKICLETEKTEGHTPSRTLVKFLYAKRDRKIIHAFGRKQTNN